MPRLIDHTGRVFGRLTAEKRIVKPGKQSWWLLRCECGQTIELTPEQFASSPTVIEKAQRKNILLHVECRTCAARGCQFCGAPIERRYNKGTCDRPECRALMERIYKDTERAAEVVRYREDEEFRRKILQRNNSTSALYKQRYKERMETDPMFAEQKRAKQREYNARYREKRKQR